jgi:hypothetical protein
MGGHQMQFTLADHFKLLEGLPLGTWVAISTEKNHILSTSLDAKTAVDEARERGETCPLILRVAPNRLQCL